MKIIPNTWETERLSIQDIRQEEIDDAQSIYEKGSYIHQWDGSNLDEEYIKRCFLEGDLPPGGTKEHFKIQVVRIKESDELVGLLITYHGYPAPESFYINYFTIDPDYHKKGLGREMVKELLDIVKQHNFKEVRANVALKNWGALRFWTKLGIDKINGIYGDPVYEEDSFADIELMKRL
ncbi:GNAT family N-acetyltransferase [Rossellomorea aquimaris]|uniref:GNAT family N-acetyltransferase n=1 Tax=Rossellomorea aquimaris TaxID=189382 RepID=UPI001CD2DAE8|nr:GNAT family N-acetyltransferase [Rossellomorea aquimaris]MCA1060179.1 GNAT family N-acetyltransferase [Rossellomorea aquimaris]